MTPLSFVGGGGECSRSSVTSRTSLFVHSVRESGASGVDLGKVREGKKRRIISRRSSRASRMELKIEDRERIEKYSHRSCLQPLRIRAWKNIGPRFLRPIVFRKTSIQSRRQDS